MPLTGKIGIDVRLKQTGPVSDIATPVVDILMSPAWLVASGVIADAADQIYADERVVTATDSIDFSGALAGYFGTVVMVKLKALIVEVVAGPGTLTLARPAVNGIALFSTAGDAMPGFAAGDLILLTHRALAGWAITAGTADLIDFTAVGGNVTIRIVAVGASA